MSIEITIRAETLQELWDMLSAFPSPNPTITFVPKGAPPPAANGDAEPETTSQEEAKRGRGRPPGAKNRPKEPEIPTPAPIAAPPPASAPVPGSESLASVDEPRPEPAPVTDEPDDSALDGEPTGSAEEARAFLTDMLTMHWKEGLKSKKDLILAFKNEAGIRMLIDMKPEHYGKARATIRALETVNEAV